MARCAKPSGVALYASTPPLKHSGVPFRAIRVFSKPGARIREQAGAPEREQVAQIPFRGAVGVATQYCPGVQCSP
jgi:hypothetical protein